jgi:hypothetical protein
MGGCEAESEAQGPGSKQNAPRTAQCVAFGVRLLLGEYCDEADEPRTRRLTVCSAPGYALREERPMRLNVAQRWRS